MSPLDAFDRILRSLHRAMLDDVHWPATSALIDEVCGMKGNGLAVSGGSGDDHRVYFAGIYRRGERRRDLEREYFELFFAGDERVPRLRQAPAGQLIHVPDLYTEDERKTSPAYNEGGRRLGSQNGLNVRFDGPDGLRIIWAASDPVAADGWQTSQLELIEHLLPHVRQFVLVRQALAAADALGAGLTGLLDNPRVGVIQLDRGGRVAAANDAARDILHRDDGLVERAGTLGAWLPADNARLRRLVAAALPAFGCGTPAGGSMTLRRRSGGARLRLHVSPVGVPQADFGGRRVVALVLVVDPSNRSHRPRTGGDDARSDAVGGPGGGLARRGQIGARRGCADRLPGRLRPLASQAGLQEKRSVRSGCLGAAGPGRRFPAEALTAPRNVLKRSSVVLLVGFSPGLEGNGDRPPVS